MINSPPGEARIKFGRKDIKINIQEIKDIQIKAIVDNTSFEWRRVDKLVLMPLVRLKIRIQSNDPDFHIAYKDFTINFQQSNKASYAELYYSLYERHAVEIFRGKELIGKIDLEFNDHKKNRVIVDYTCSRNDIVIKGLENEHISLGCHTRRIGKFGKERPMLEISWVSPELKIIGSEHIPYQAAFLNRLPVNIRVLNIKTGIEKEITITARIPKRLHRLFTAYGLGPYAFNTEIVRENEVSESKQVDMAPALMFYLNYKVSESSSVRGFDAAIFQESRFNNAGLYLGSDFGHMLDNKIYFTTLLGVQYLYFKYDDDSPDISEPIFPQGLEFMYRHAFDIPNYIVSGGFFLSTENDIEYENIWVRWGKNYFWELNLISWGKDQFKAKTWGISVGFPFKGFL